MKHHSRLAATVLAVTLLFSANLSLAAGQDVKNDLLELLATKGVITREEAQKLNEKPDQPTTALDAVIELLRSKGTITADEAEVLKKKGAEQAAGEQPGKKAFAGKKAAEPVAAEALLPEKELRPVIDVLKEQGVLGNDEAEQIKERYGTKWARVEGEDFIAIDEQEIEYSRTTLPRELVLSNILKLKHQGLIDEEEAERIRLRFQRKLALERVTDSIGESVQRDMRSEVAAKILPIPEWTQRFKLKGDLRLRYRADQYDKNNSNQIPRPDVFQSSPFPLMNTTQDRNYFQIRARLGLTAKVADGVEAGIGLATGNTSNPVSTNSTLGDSLNKKNFLLDQAYLKWNPLPELTVWGGRFENPWFGSDLVWDPDINFDGLAVNWKLSVSPDLGLFFTAGAFPIEEVELSSHDKWLYAGQVGANYSWRNKLNAAVAVAYYHFDNITGKATTVNDFQGATDSTRPRFMQKGNTPFYLDQVFRNPNEGWLGLAAQFKELHFSSRFSYTAGDEYPLLVSLIGDYVNNLGYNTADVNAKVTAAIRKETEGFQVGLSVGTPELRSLFDWKAMLNYKYLEADAVVDGFTESDFHLGGTNAKGWILGADLGLAKNVWLNTRWFTANEISGPPLGIDVFQINLNAKF